MNICYVFDESFSSPACVSIFSLLANNQDIDEINFYIFDDGIEKQTKARLSEMIKKYNRMVRFIEVTNIVEKLKNMQVNPWRGRYSAYIKLMLVDFLPQNLQRIIVLDADTIIDGSIKELNEMNLNNHPCAMALEGVHNKYKKYTGLGENELYNAGVIVIDIEKWQEQRVEERLLFHLKEIYAAYMLPEEDPISIVLQKDVERLNPKFNYITIFYYYTTKRYFKRFQWDTLKGCFYTLKELSIAKNDIRIYHCTDTFTNRPWNQNNIHPYTQKYDFYLKQTYLKNEKKKKLKMCFPQKAEYLLRKYLPVPCSKFMYYLAARIYYTSNARVFYKNRATNNK